MDAILPKTSHSLDLQQRYLDVRSRSARICQGLNPEDFVIQSAEHVSPPKWHLAHTTWFFETFILQPHHKDYKLFHPEFNYIFNSYYESKGERLRRDKRGLLNRPRLAEVLEYRKHVDEAMLDWLGVQSHKENELMALFEIGLQHEMQHQELLYTDIKFILGHNPLQEAYSPEAREDRPGEVHGAGWIEMDAGLYHIGFDKSANAGFSFDNEHCRHRVFLEAYAIASTPVTYGEYVEFIESGAYDHFAYWHSEGWDWKCSNGIKSPMYMFCRDGKWMRYSLSGIIPVNMQCPVLHLSWYEAAAYAAWRGERLPTEQEWEAGSDRFAWGQSWEWTGSAYRPYPGYVQPKGAVGEYNGKFMINQMVLRGASPATYPGHSRSTYRNFFHPHYQWQFTGLRLARSI